MDCVARRFRYNARSGGFMLAPQPITQWSVQVWCQTHGIVAWLLLGLVAGWLAGKLARGRGYRCITDIILGLIGSYLGGWIFTKLGIFGGGFLYSLASATLGAVILVGIAHAFISSGRVAPGALHLSEAPSHQSGS